MSSRTERVKAYEELETVKMASVSDIKGVATEETIEERRKRAIKGAIFSEFIDMFDIYLPVIILAPIAGVFFVSKKCVR